MKKTVLVLTLLAVVSFSTMMVFADVASTPADIYAELTGMTAVEAYELKGDKTFGDLARENGFYDEFSVAFNAVKIQIINDKVVEGLIGEEEASKLIELLGNCDGSQSQVLKNSGFSMRFGQGKGFGNGQGRGYGNGTGEALKAQDGTGYQRGGRGGKGLGRK